MARISLAYEVHNLDCCTKVLTPSFKKCGFQDPSDPPHPRSMLLYALQRSMLLKTVYAPKFGSDSSYT